MRQMIESSKDSGVRAMTDMDARIISLNAKISHAEDTLENKITTVSVCGYVTVWEECVCVCVCVRVGLLFISCKRA